MLKGGIIRFQLVCFLQISCSKNFKSIETIGVEVCWPFLGIFPTKDQFLSYAPLPPAPPWGPKYVGTVESATSRRWLSRVFSFNWRFVETFAASRTVFGGSWELGPSIGEWENLPVAPDDGKGQKLMEPYHVEQNILQKLKQNLKTKNYKYIFETTKQMPSCVRWVFSDDPVIWKRQRK